MKKHLPCFVVLAFLVVSCVGFVSPVETNPVGKIYRDSIGFEDVTLPLPDGEWNVTGRGYSREGFFQIILFNHKTQDVVYIQRDSYRTDRPFGYNNYEYMRREDVHHAVVKNNYTGEQQDGWLINHIRPNIDPKNGQVFKETTDYIAKIKYSLPGNYILNYHRFTGNKQKPSRFLEYNYFVNPETAGFKPPEQAEWASSDWHPMKINKDPAKVAYIEKLKKDGEIMHEKLAKAFGG